MLERHVAHAARRGHLRNIARAVSTRQAIGRHNQFGGSVGAGAARDRVAAAQQHDLMLGIRAGAGLDDATGHQAADQHRVAAECGRVNQRRTQAAVQARIAKDTVQRVRQHRRRLARRQRRAVRLIRGRQARVRQREIPLAVFVQRVAQGTRLRPELVGALVASKCVVAQTALQDVGACAADQSEIAAIIRAVQRDDGARVRGRAGRCGGVNGAIVLQGHGVHAAQGHRRGGSRAHGRVRQRGRGLVAAEGGVAVHARDVFGGAARGQIANHQIVAAAPADAVLAAAVGHGNDVVAQAADDVVAMGAARANDVADVQHAGHATGVVQAGVAVLEVQVDGDVVFIGRVVQRGLAGHAEEHLHIKIADQRGGAIQVVDAAVGGHACAQVNGNAATRLHAGGDVNAILGEVQRVAALASLLGQGEADGAACNDVGVAAAAAADDVLRIVDGDGGVAHHRDLVAALRRTFDSADRAHIAESGRRRRRNFFAIGVRRGAGQVHRDAGGVPAVVQQGLAVQRGADQVEGLAADLQALCAVGRLEHHVHGVLRPDVSGVHRRILNLVGVVVADDGGDVALDGREVQRVVAVLVVVVAHPDAVFLLHALTHFDRRDSSGGAVVEDEGVVAAVADQVVVGGHALQGRAARLQAGGAGHHAVPAGDRDRVGVDDAVAVVQHPVAAQRGAADRVRRGGHVCARDGGQAVHEGDAALAGGHVAAVQQQVAVVRQRVAPGAQLFLVGVELAFAQRGGAQGQRPGAAVAHDLHRSQILVLAQNLRDLVHAVVTAVQHDDLGVVRAQHLHLRAFARGLDQAVQAFGLAADQAVQALHDLLGVINGRVHEDDLAHRRLFRLSGVAGKVRRQRRRLGRVRFLPGQPRLGVALARGVGLGVLVQRQHVAVLRHRLEGRAFHQIRMGAGRGGLFALMRAGCRIGRRHNGRLVAGRRRRRHEQVGRHEITAFQRLEEWPPAEQGLLHLARGTAGPQFARQFLHAHIVARHLLLQAPDAPRILNFPTCAGGAAHVLPFLLCFTESAG